MEMNYEVIKSYFNLIQEHTIDGGYFLNINRYEKRTVGYPIRISEYPYDNFWKVIISEPSFHQRKIHFLLTQRNYEKDGSNIKAELNNIKKIEKKFIPKNIILIKILKLIFGVNLLKTVGRYINKLSYKLINIS